MAGPNTVSTTVTPGSLRTNYARIGHAAQEIFPELLQELLAIKVPQARLYSYVSSNGYLSRTLRADQWSMINNARTHGYVNFDIPLIYKLIRKLTTVHPPTRGWDSGYPASTEITTGDDIERIRQTRNKVLHRGNAKVSDTELKDYFDLFRDIARRLEQYLSKPKDEFVKRFTELETCSMDENTENMYLQSLEKLKKRDEDVYKELEKVQDKVDKVHGNVETLQNKVEEKVDQVQHQVDKVQHQVDEVQHKVDNVECTDYLKMTVDAWLKENENFVKTSVVKDISECLTNYHVFCLTGKSGIGKSATMQHIALCLRDTQGYTIYPCDCPSEIKTYYKEGQKQLFVFNDVCGKYTLLQNYVDEWIKRKDDINRVIATGNIKILATCRSQVFNESQFQRIKLFTTNQCNLSSDKYTLDEDKKLQIAKQYLPEDVVDCIKSEIDQYDFLPLMFPMYKSFQKQHRHADPKAFFNNPFDIYTKEINELRDSIDKEKIVALFYLVVNNGFIDQSSFEDEEKEDVRKTRENIFEACGLNRGTPRQRIREQLDCLLDFLVIKSIISPTCAGYTAMHDKIFDFLCFYFGNNLQDAFIRYADSDVIIERTQLKCNDNSANKLNRDTEKRAIMDTDTEKGLTKNTYDDFTILIEGDKEQIYFERIIKDMSLERVDPWDVLLNYQMKNAVYRRKLLNFIQKLDDVNWRNIIKLKTVHNLLCVLCELGTFWTGSSGNNKDDDYNEDDDDELSHDRFNFVKLFLEKGANVNNEDGHYGNSALTMACERADTLTVKLLLENGADVNPAYPDISPITAACYYDPSTPDQHQDQHEVIKLLLDKGANVNYVEKCRISPLTTACAKWNITLVKILLERGADVNLDNDGLFTSPIVAACDYDPSTPDQHQDQHEVIKLLLDKGANVNHVDKSGNSPLTKACARRNITLVKILLERGADVNLDNDGLYTSPIVAACDYDPSTPDPHQDQHEVIKLLLDKGANVNHVHKSGYSPLTKACARCNITLVKILLERGADVNLDNDGLYTSPIVAACDYDPSTPDQHQDQHEVVKLLLDKGANVNHVHKYGYSPLTKACTRCNITLVKILLERGADVNLDNDSLYTSPIVAACVYDPSTPDQHQDQHEVVKLLLDKGANVNHFHRSGYSPLTKACTRCNITLVQILLEGGADVNLDNDGFYTSPIVAACDYNPSTPDQHQDQHEVIKLLLDKGANVNHVEKSGNSPLTKACAWCNITLVKFLLERGADVNLDNDRLKTSPITEACSYRPSTPDQHQDQHKVIKLLLDKGANVNHVDKSGNSPLTTACARCNTTSVKFLLERGADVNLDHDHLNISPIVAACVYDPSTPYEYRDKDEVVELLQNQNQIVELLLDKGVNVNTVDMSGNSPLTNACARCNITLVKILLERGADVNLDNDRLKTSPIKEACCYRPSTPDQHQDQHKVIKLLLDKGANVNYVEKSGISPLTTACARCNITFVKILLERGADVNPNNDRLNTSPITAACGYHPFTPDQHQDQHEVIKLLLDKGANVNYVDKSGNSPLTIACVLCNITLVKILLERGADVNLDNDRLNTSPITAACGFRSSTQDQHQDQHEIIKLLLDKGANVNYVDDSRNSPLTIACARCNVTLVEILLERGADVNLDNDRLYTSPFTAACCSTPDEFRDKNKVVEFLSNQNQIVELLLDKGANVNTVDKSGNSPLTNACRNGYITLVKFLIEKGADVNPDNDNLFTSPITVACDYEDFILYRQQRHTKIVELLLDKGVNVNTVDKSGNSPLTNACRNGNITLIKFLIEKGAKVNPENDGLNTTPITAACDYEDFILYRQQRHTKIVELLLDKGVNVNTVDKSGNSPLTNACRNGSITLVKFLIEKRAEVNPENDGLNTTPITAACDYNPRTPDERQHQHQIVELLLLDKGVNVNTVDRSGNSALTNACKMSNFELVVFLIEKGADVNLENCHLRQTPITATCDSKYSYYYKLKIIDLLLEKEANINAVDKSMNSPLTTACRQGNSILVWLLLERGADVNLKNAGLHHTPLTTACDLDKPQVNYKIIQLLLDHGANINAKDKAGNSPLAIAYNRCNLELIIFLHKTYPGGCQCMSSVDNFVKEKQVESVHDLTECQEKTLICILKEEDKNRCKESHFQAIEKEDINCTYRTSVEQKHIESMDILNSTKRPSTENIEIEIHAKRKKEEES